MADIITFARRWKLPMGISCAREAVLDIFQLHACDDPEDPAAVESADVFLLELARRGYKVVPLE
jgi:hypothetical protein